MKISQNIKWNPASENKFIRIRMLILSEFVIKLKTYIFCGAEFKLNFLLLKSIAVVTIKLNFTAFTKILFEKDFQTGLWFFYIIYIK